MYESMREQASFAIIAICFAYLEGVQQYMDGQSSKNAGRRFFAKSFQRAFSSCGLEPSQIDMLYEQGRCGLFHDGMTRTQVIYDMSLGLAFSVTNNGSQDLFRFHPEHLLGKVEDDFGTFINLLRGDGNPESRKNFDTMFSAV
jgi:hypothetical protein